MMNKPLLPLLAGVVLLAACSRAAEAPSAPRPVYVATIAQDAGAVQRLSATLQSRTEVELGFRTGGRVQERLVDAGQFVRAGQPLARLERQELQLAVAAAEAQRDAARVDQSQQQRDAARLQRLAGDGTVGTADEERQRSGAAAALERLRAAEAQLGLAQQGLAHAELRAPFDGVITSVALEPGLVAPIGQPLIAIAAPRQLELQVDLPQALAEQARKLRAEALGQAWTLRELAPAAHPQTRTHRARFVPTKPLAWQDGLLGSSVELQLQGSTAPAISLPGSALLAKDGEARVWRVEGDRLLPQSVQLLARSGDRVMVSGLQPGQQIVVLGAHKLDAGQRVRAVKLERQP
jgi:RND family efflux transporter MFP subunit